MEASRSGGGACHTGRGTGGRYAGDALIVEGYGVHAPCFAAMKVYATQVTIKALPSVDIVRTRPTVSGMLAWPHTLACIMQGIPALPGAPSYAT